MGLRGWLGGALALALAGCPSPDPATGLGTTQPPDQFLDYNQFVCAVEPVLIKRCSFLACHGNATHAFRVYSLGKLRIGDPTTRKARSFDLLSADEVERNFESASGMVYGTAAGDRTPTPVVNKVTLLLKPLKAAFGGSEHHGVGVFPAFPATTLDDDGEWQSLVAWVGGAAQPKPVDAKCQALFDAMSLAPR